MSETGNSVTFVVTVYNKQPFLPAVLAALAGQTGDFARTFVFVDDGSTDESLTCLRDLTTGWRDCLIVSQANQGASRAMNVGVRHAGSTYVKLVDADDLLVPAATERLLAALRDSRSVLALGASAPYDPAKPVVWPAATKISPWDVVAAPLRPSLRGSTTNPSCMLFARDDYMRVGGADESVCCQDYSLLLPLARLGSFVKIRDTLVLTPSSAPGRLSDNQARELHDVTRALGHFVRAAPELSRAERNYAVRRASGRALLWARRHGRPDRALRYFLLSLRARLGLIGDASAAILGCCGVYDYAPPIPIAPGEARLSIK